MEQTEQPQQSNDITQESIAHSKRIIQPLQAGMATEAEQKIIDNPVEAPEQKFIPVAPGSNVESEPETDAPPLVSEASPTSTSSVSTTPTAPVASATSSLYPVPLQTHQRLEQQAALLHPELFGPKVRPLGIWILSIWQFIGAFRYGSALAVRPSLVTLLLLAIQLIFAFGLFFGVEIVRKISVILIIVSLVLSAPGLLAGFAILALGSVQLLTSYLILLVGIAVNIWMLFYLRSDKVKAFFAR
jgi:hypothetical protein